MHVEMRSRGVLVAWVSHCLIHAAAAAAHPVVARFGCGLDGGDLRHLVLLDRCVCMCVFV